MSLSPWPGCRYDSRIITYASELSLTTYDLSLMTDELSLTTYELSPMTYEFSLMMYDVSRMTYRQMNCQL